MCITDEIMLDYSWPLYCIINTHYSPWKWLHTTAAGLFRSRRGNQPKMLRFLLSNRKIARTPPSSVKLSWITRATLLSTSMKKTLALDTRHSVTNLRPRPQYAGEIRKRNFISTLLDLPSTLIRHENGGFWKRSSNQRNLKTQIISTVRPAVHTNPSRKRSSNRRNLKTQNYFYG